MVKKTKPKISLIIPAYNEEKYIKSTLESVKESKKLYEKTFKEKVEIIVVDNNSTDKTADIAREYECEVVNFKRHNIAAVKNAGAKRASGEILAFIDADSSIIPKDTFINIHKNLKNKEIFGGGSRCLPDKIKIFAFDFGIVELLFRFILLEKIYGICLVLLYLRKTDFEEIGGFNETIWSLEDAEFAHKMKRVSIKKNQKLRHLKKPVIVCTRKNKFIPFWKNIGLLIKSFEKDFISKKENSYELWYDVDNLR